MKRDSMKPLLQAALAIVVAACAFLALATAIGRAFSPIE